MERLKESSHLEDMGVDGRIILQWILNHWGEGRGDQVHLAQDRDNRRADVNMAMNLQVP